MGLGLKTGAAAAAAGAGAATAAGGGYMTSAASLVGITSGAVLLLPVFLVIGIWAA